MKRLHRFFTSGLRFQVSALCFLSLQVSALAQVPLPLKVMPSTGVIADPISAATFRSANGLALGTDVQAWSANLDTFATVSTVSATELGYLDGVTSAIQTQLNTNATAITTEATARDAAIVLAQDAQSIRAKLPHLFKGGSFVGMSMAFVGDSITLQTYLSVFQYYGAAVYRPLPAATGAGISRSATTVTCGAAVFQTNDVGGTIYFDSGGSSLITGFISGTQVTVADSGTIASTSGHILINGDFTGNEGSPLYGLTIYHCGDNGQTAAGFISGSGTYPLSFVIGLNPTVIFVRYGTNDVRLGATNQSTLTGYFTTIASTIHSALPNTDMVFGIAPPMLSTDPTSSGYVSPLGSAQTYSNIIAAANEALDGVNANVFVWDTRRSIFPGDTCPATAPWMNDILHPNGYGQTAIAVGFVKLLGGFPKPVFNQNLSDAAFLTNPTAPWTVYKLALEDPRYFTQVAAGSYSGNGAGYIDITPKRYGNAFGYADRSFGQNVRMDDIYLQDGLDPFVLTASGSNQGGTSGYMRISMTAPVALTGSGIGSRVRIFRSLAANDPEAFLRLSQPDTWPFAMQVNMGPAANLILITPWPDTPANRSRLSQITSSDTLTCAGQSALSLSGFTFSWQISGGASGNLLASKTGTWTGYSGRGWIFGGAARNPVNTLAKPNAPVNGQPWIDSTLGLQFQNAATTYTVPRATATYSLDVTTIGNTTVTLPTSGTLATTAGNVATATALATARTINGTSFNGTADITVTAAAGTLTGSTLASGVTASSLTSAAGGAFGTAAYVNTTTFTAAPVAAPSTATSTGTAGTWSYDASYVYVCIATDTWVRAALSTW